MNKYLSHILSSSILVGTILWTVCGESVQAALIPFKLDGTLGENIESILSEGFFNGSFKENSEKGTMEDITLDFFDASGGLVTSFKKKQCEGTISCTWEHIIIPPFFFRWQYDVITAGSQDPLLDEPPFNLTIVFEGEEEGINADFISGTLIFDDEELEITSATLELIPVPEPTSNLSLLALGTLGAASTLKRKLKPTNLSEKEILKAD